MSTDKQTLTATTEVYAPIETIWQLWTTPADIMQWNNTSDEWHTPLVENDVRPGGKFLFKMGLKNGSFNFDFTGTYDEVEPNKLISYTLDDNRRSTVTFTGENPIIITEAFEPTYTEPIDMQQEFCKAVLESFKRYTEAKYQELKI